MLSLLAFLLATTIAPRFATGMAGWIRHLPARSRHHRRLTALSIVIAEMPILVPLLALDFATAGKNGPLEAAYAAAGLLTAAFGAALLALPVERPLWSATAGLCGCVLGGSGTPWLWAGGIVLLILSDLGAGHFSGRAAAVRGRSIQSGPIGFFLSLSRKALGPRLLLPFVPAAAVFFSMNLFLRNNPLPERAAESALRFGALTAVIAFLAGQAKLLGQRRPIWTWSRSLPLSAARRILGDSLFLGGPAGLIIIPFFLSEPRAALCAAAALPFAALRAAAALRPSMESNRSPIPGFILEGGLAAGMLALFPFSAFGFLAAVPIALGVAVRRERSIKAGRWLELHHSASGDPLTWSP
jgi:hypothetical protein